MPAFDMFPIKNGLKQRDALSPLLFNYKYLGTTLTHQNSIQEKIKTRLKSVNTCNRLM
jgi:hypothetical protein